MQNDRLFHGENIIHTGSQPWDKIWDFSKYRLAKVRRVVRRYKIMEMGDEVRKISKRKNRDTN